MHAVNFSPVRHACPSEKRLIVRHKHKFYNNLLVAGIYKFPPYLANNAITKVETYTTALRTCLEQHPFLCVVAKEDKHSDFIFARASRVDVREHFHTIDPASLSPSEPDSEDVLLANAIEHLCNDDELTFFDTIATKPGWRVDVLPLEPSDGSPRAFVSFTFAHTHADGMSGVAFQKTFLGALSKSLRQPLGVPHPEYFFETSEMDLPVLPHLPVSLLYLLGPALGHYLPSFLSKVFGLKASTSGSDEGTWTGPKTFLNASTRIPPVTTCVEVLGVDNKIVSKVLSQCRQRNTKLTPAMNEILAQCFSRHLPAYSSDFASKTNLICTVPTNIRKLAGYSDDTIGTFVSATYTRHDVDHSVGVESKIEVDDRLWFRAGKAAALMANATSKLQNQPIGLLAWISNFDTWMKEQLGKGREASWELSNLLAFDGDGGDVKVERALFCQPASLSGPPIDLNAISVRDGELVICASWQVGALGFDKMTDAPESLARVSRSEGNSNDANTESNERAFVRQVLADLDRYLLHIAV